MTCFSKKFSFHHFRVVRFYRETLEVRMSIFWIIHKLRRNLGALIPWTALNPYTLLFAPKFKKLLSGLLFAEQTS